MLNHGELEGVLEGVIKQGVLKQGELKQGL